MSRPTRHWWHEYSWVHVTGDMNNHEYLSWVTWIIMSTRHGWHEYSWLHVTGGMNIHEHTSRVAWIFMSTRHGWHEYSWAHVTIGMNIHEHTSRVAWIFMSTRHGWHEYSWAHVTGGMNIHESITGGMNIHESITGGMSTRHGWQKFTSPMTEYSWAHITGNMNNHEHTSRVTWIIMKHVTGDMNIREYTSRLTYIQEYTSPMTEYSWAKSRGLKIREHTSRVTELWVHVTGDINIHEYTSRVTWIFMSTRHGDMNIPSGIFMITHGWNEYSWMAWHILIPGFLIVPKSLGGTPILKGRSTLWNSQSSFKIRPMLFYSHVTAPDFGGHRGAKMYIWGGKNLKIKNAQMRLIFVFLLIRGNFEVGAEPATGGKWPPAPVPPLLFHQKAPLLLLLLLLGLLYFLNKN